MKYIKLGSTQIKVSVIALGTWAIGGIRWGGTNEKDSVEAIEAAFESGVNFIDTAPSYGRGLSEEYIAKAINKKRDKVVIATKCGLRWDLKKGVYFLDHSPGIHIYKYLGKESIEYEIDLSLKRLKTDYIDLYQSHAQDPTTPIMETMETFLKLKEKGKIRAIGVSNANIEQIKEYLQFGVLNTDQEKFSMLDRAVETEILPFCQNNHITMLAYSPLAQGLLTGKLIPDRKFNNYETRFGNQRFSVENIKKTYKLLEKHLKQVIVKHNTTYGNIATAWITSKPNCIAIVGARNRNQAVENAYAGSIKLDKEDKEAILRFINEYGGLLSSI